MTDGRYPVLDPRRAQIPATSREPLRVLHLGKFYPPHRGGVETYSEGLCRRLASEVNVKVVVAGGNEDTEEIIDDVSVLRLRTWKTLAATPLCTGMIHAIRSYPCDIIHLQWPNPFAVIAYLLTASRAHLVITYHSDVIRQKYLGAIFAPILKMALHRSDAIIVTSPNYGGSSSVLSRFRDRCRVIPLGISPESMNVVDHSAVRQLRMRFGPRIVMSAGRLVYYKGLQFLIRAMKSVNAHLVIVGTGPLKQELLTQVENDGLSGRVTLVGEVDDIVSYYHAADVFTLPSIARSEAFGIVQLEAMACGKAVVNTNLQTGVPYVAPHGVAGLTVEPANSAELASALRILLHNDRFRLRLGEAGRSRVLREFSLERMFQSTLDLFHEVASKGLVSGRMA
jgi:glycosyltransferase involved in cell wall biosynthesis